MIDADTSQVPCRVVIADDVDGIRALLRHYLAEETGMEVVGEAANGQEALAVAAETNPDVLLLDLSMPKMDGMEVLEAIRRQDCRFAVVVFSSLAGERIETQVRARGARAYVEKSAPMPKVVEAIRAACEEPRPT